MKKILSSMMLVLILVMGCATVKSEKPVVVEHQERIFWEIKGPNNSIFIQGTIHAGTDEMYPIDKNVLDAFNKAEKIYAEIGDDEMERLETKIIGLVQNSEQSDPKNYLNEILPKEDSEFMVQLFTQQGFDNLKKYEPWVANTTLTSVILQTARLDPTKGIDLFFYQLADQQNKKVLGLDTLQAQLDIIVGGDTETQLNTLKETLHTIKDNTALEDLKELINAYIQNDRKTLETIMASEETFESYTEEAYNALIVDRNTNWAETFAKLLEQDEDVFVFAGAAHFFGQDSVFEIMRKNGTLSK